MLYELLIAQGDTPKERRRKETAHVHARAGTLLNSIGCRTGSTPWELAAPPHSRRLPCSGLLASFVGRLPSSCHAHTAALLNTYCRTYILDAIDSSVDMINDGIIMLQEAAPNPKLFPKLQSMRVRLHSPQWH